MARSGVRDARSGSGDERVSWTGAKQSEEKQFQARIVQLARTLHYECYHTWLSIRSAKGWPDLVLCKPPRLLFVELKAAGKKPTPSQQKWLDMLRASGQEVYVWGSSDDLQQITDILQGTAVREEQRA